MDQDWDTWDKPYRDRHWWRIDLGTTTDYEIHKYTNARLYDFNDAFKNSSAPDAYEFFCFFCEDFKTFTAKDFKRLEQRYLEKVREQLRTWGIDVSQGDVIQSLLKLLEEYNKRNVSTTPPPALPFASFRQESIPLHLQYKELPKERQERRQKRAQNPKRRSQPTTKYSPQHTTCRHCNENFSSRNALFRHLKLCKSSRSRACSMVSSRSSASSVASAPSVSSRVSKASSTSSASSATSVSSTPAITSIKKV
jgi:outer membrane biosynthesis protein TonB